MTLFYRKTDWVWYPEQDKTCKSKVLRHGVCIYVVEDLYRTRDIPEMFLNKIVPTMEFGSFYCLKERLFNQNYNKEKAKTSLKANDYLNLLHVRYHRERFKPGFELKNFKCKL